MLIRSKTIILAACLFLIAFKVLASGIFIQAALERAHHSSPSRICMIAPQDRGTNQSSDSKHHQASSLNLMSHITANLSNAAVILFTPPEALMPSALPRAFAFTQNFPDSAFKPPKAIA